MLQKNFDIIRYESIDYNDLAVGTIDAEGI